MATPATHDRENFLEGMRYTASTVNIVTTDGPAGKAGVTVSAMTPVSADGETPTLLVCVHHLSPACKAILANKVFGVNILSQQQSFIADTFAGRLKARDDDKFSCTEWIIGKTGVPLVLHSLVSFECQLLENTRVGSHHIFIGGVANTRLQKDELPLIYSNRAYGSPARIAIHTNHTQDLKRTPQLCIGCPRNLVLTFLPELVADFLEVHPEINFTLVERPQEQLLQFVDSGACEIAFLPNSPKNTNFKEYPLAGLNHFAVVSTRDKNRLTDPLTMQQLVELPLLYWGSSCFPEAIDLLGAAGVTSKPIVQSSSMGMILDMVEQGLGYVVLISLTTNPPLMHGRDLRVLPLPQQAGEGELVMVTPDTDNSSIFARQFAAFCKQNFTTEKKEKL